MHFCAVEEILDSVEERFLKEMDAATIAFSLESKKIIDDGDRKAIRGAHGKKGQNETLFAILKEKCTMETLLVVCDVIINVQGNPKMVAFGKYLRSQLPS